MKKTKTYRLEGHFLVFHTTHLTLKAEDILKAAGFRIKLFPKPRTVISECGLIVRIEERDVEKIRVLLKEKGLPIKEVLSL